jgi:NAD(P)-dependent dehydrogenase (short-subunit alcohol dehydrogenase family)
MIDTNLTGVWHAAKAAIPHLRAGGRGGGLAARFATAGSCTGGSGSRRRLGHRIVSWQGTAQRAQPIENA